MNSNSGALQLTVNVTDEDAQCGTSPRTPTTPTVRRSLKPKTRLNLEDAWRKAEILFEKESGGKRLGDLKSSGKDDVLQKWQEVYVIDSSEDRVKKQQMYGLLSNVVNAVELVGAFASQAASVAFPPAGMCFSAIQIMIDAPRQIQKVYDGLQALFQEVEKFLVKFRIYQRIDTKFGLDEDLVANTNTLLISFVKICALATRLLHGGRWTSFKTAFKVVLFQDDSGVPAELENFRRLAQDQSMLTGTVTLEHVMQSEESINQILGVADDIKRGMGTLISNSNDEKTRFVLRNKLEKIEEKLFKKGIATESFWKALPEELLPETYDFLSKTSEYQQWYDSTNSTSILLISGSNGSGKTRILDAIKDHLDGKREEAEKIDPSIYVAAYSFEDQRVNLTTDKKAAAEAQTTISRIPFALKAIALQVARQSTTYANDLYLQVRGGAKMVSQVGQQNFRFEEDVERVWKTLRLSKFVVSKPSTLYILLDAIEQEELIELESLLNILTESEHWQIDRPQLKVVLTANASKEKVQNMLLKRNLPTVIAETVGQKLIPSFLTNEMAQMNLFQDADKETRRLKRDIWKTITASPDMTFYKVRQKVGKLQDAIDKGAPRSDMSKLLGEASTTGTGEDGQTRVKNFEKSTTAANCKLLNSIIMWLLTSPRRSMTIEGLQAALYLEGADLPIEPLIKRINHQFSKIMSWKAEWVCLHENVEEFLLATSKNSVTASTSAQQNVISVDISVKNASESTFKQFVWDLNQHVNGGGFDFHRIASETPNHIRFDEVRAYVDVVRLLFKVLNEGWDDDTLFMVGYAYTALPLMLFHLQNMESSVMPSDRKMIGEGLISYLRDPYMLELGHLSIGDGAWMTDNDKTSALKFWLEDSVTRQQLPLKERRWLDQVLDTGYGPLGFLKDRTLAIAHQWLTDFLAGSDDCCSWINNYLAAIELEREKGQTNEKGGIESTEQEHQNLDTPTPEALDSVPDVNGTPSGENGISSNDQHQYSETSDTVESVPKAEQLTNGPKPQATEDEATNASSNVTEDNDGPLTTNPGLASSILPEEPDAANLTNGQHNENAEETADPSSDVEVIEPDEDLVDQALQWALSETKLSLDATGELIMGNTYVARQQWEASVNHYLKAVDDVKIRPYALYGLGAAYLMLGDSKKAMQCGDECFLILRARFLEGPLEPIVKQKYGQLLKGWSDWQEENEKEGGLERSPTLALREDIMNVWPEDASFLWAVLKLRCLVDETQSTALELLGRYLAGEDQLGRESLAHLMLDMTESDDFDTQLEPLVRNIRNEELRYEILQVVAEALRHAGRTPITIVHTRLFYLQGLLYALSSDSENQLFAVQIWEKILNTYPQKVEDLENILDPLKAVSMNLIRHKFDTLRNRYVAGTDWSDSEKKGMFDDLSSHHKRIMRICQGIEFESGIDGTTGYLVAFANVLDMTETARQGCRDDVSQALEILSDTDPDNDDIAFGLLVRVFWRLNDKVSALTAFSLYDRDLLVKRSQLQGDGDEETLEEKIKQGWTGYCDGCRKSLYSSDVSGRWICQYCPNYDLCVDCKTKFQDGKIRLENCNPAHVQFYLRLLHVEYSKTELEINKVRIEWQHQDTGNDTFARIGGRIVDLDTWVEDLRRLWDLPKLVSDGSRAQK